MELKMFLGEKLIDAIPITATSFLSRNYIDYLKFELMDRNEQLLELSDQEPSFAIDTVPSSINIHNTFDAILSSINKNKKNQE